MEPAEEQEPAQPPAEAGAAEGQDLIDNLDPSDTDAVSGTSDPDPEPGDTGPSEPQVTGTETGEPELEPEAQADQREPTDQADPEPTPAKSDTAENPDLIDNLDTINETTVQPESPETETTHSPDEIDNHEPAATEHDGTAPEPEAAAAEPAEPADTALDQPAQSNSAELKTGEAGTQGDAAPPPSQPIDGPQTETPETQPPETEMTEQPGQPEALDYRLQGHLDNSEVTPGGRAFYEPNDTDMFDAANDVPPDPGQYTVDMHGDPQSTYIGNDAISADDLGAMLENDSNYNGEPVRLFSCETGQGADPYAQDLADRLGIDVTAPTELAWSDDLGNTYVASAAGVDAQGRPIPTTPPDGGWRVFHPRR